MTNILSNRGWVAALAATILCLAALALATSAQAAPGTITSLKVGSATTAPDTNVTISITASGTNIGAYGVNIAYDASKVTPTACTSAFGTCNVASPTQQGAVYINGSSLTGFGGTDTALGTITFHAGAALGTAALTATVTSLADTDTTTLTVTPTNGSITIAVPATPSPTAAATTPAVLPSTGGSLTDGNPTSASSMATWLLVAAGLVVVSGGAWAISRARREI